MFVVETMNIETNICNSIFPILRNMFSKNLSLPNNDHASSTEKSCMSTSTALTCNPRKWWCIWWWVAVQHLLNDLNLSSPIIQLVFTYQSLICTCTYAHGSITSKLISLGLWLKLITKIGFRTTTHHHPPTLQTFYRKEMY